jgi:hypothetical protein
VFRDRELRVACLTCIYSVSSIGFDLFSGTVTGTLLAEIDDTNQKQSNAFVSPGDELYFTFQSDGENEANGFNILFFSNQSGICVCQNYLIYCVLSLTWYAFTPLHYSYTIERQWRKLIILHHSWKQAFQILIKYNVQIIE